MANLGCFFVVVGPSGAGKTTIIRSVRQLLPQSVELVSLTTRLPRPGETDNVDYRFVSQAEFEARLAAGDFFESAEVYGCRYGSLLSELDRLLTEFPVVIKTMDTVGALKALEVRPKTKLFGVTAPLADLRCRLASRGGSSTDLARRIVRVELEDDFVRQRCHAWIENLDGSLEDKVKSFFNFIAANATLNS